MAEKLFLQAKQFIELGNRLNEKGLKKKEIAQELGLYPSAYSALMNLIFPRLVELGEEGEQTVEEIHKAFARVNNVSEKRVRREIKGYLERLTSLDSQAERASSGILTTSFLTQLIEDSPSAMLKKLVGIYHCYYISSFSYQVKQEPFLIWEGENQSFKVQKGNALSPSYYEGFLYLSNHQLLTIQLQELETIDPDHFFIHFSLPPSYPANMSLIKGLSVSMSNSYHPISRRMILKRVEAKVDRDVFQQMETIYFSKEDSTTHCEVVAYLYDSVSLMEYLPVPRPRFDLSDLQRELQISRTLEGSGS